MSRTSYNIQASSARSSADGAKPIHTLHHAKIMTSYLAIYNPTYVERMQTQDNAAFIRLADGHGFENDVMVMKIAFNTLLEALKIVKLPQQCRTNLIEILTDAKATFTLHSRDWKNPQIGAMYNLIKAQAEMMEAYTVEEWDKICTVCLNQQKASPLGTDPDGKPQNRNRGVTILKIDGNGKDRAIEKAKKIAKTVRNRLRRKSANQGDTPELSDSGNVILQGRSMVRKVKVK